MKVTQWHTVIHIVFLCHPSHHEDRPEHDILQGSTNAQSGKYFSGPKNKPPPHSKTHDFQYPRQICVYIYFGFPSHNTTCEETKVVPILYISLSNIDTKKQNKTTTGVACELKHYQAPGADTFN